MNKPEAIATVKAINRHLRKHWHGGVFGWDYATFSAVHPGLCSVFNKAASVIAGRKGRFLPRA